VVITADTSVSRSRGNNRDSQPTGRLTFGAHASNVASSGLDLTVSDSRIDRPAGTYDSWYFSAGHMVGGKVYLTGEFSTALSVFRNAGQDGVSVETLPRTKLFATSAVINLTRAISLQITGERMLDQTVNETRILAGIPYRF
jgi:hypothetical protein